MVALLNLPPADSYSPAQKLIHWVILVLCIGQFPTAQAIHRTHQEHPFGLPPSPADLLLHQVHAWSGWGILLLAILLLALHFFRGVPPPPARAPWWHRQAARISHAGLYLGLVLLVITGTGAMYVSAWFAPVHGILTKAGIGLVALHTVAALWHTLVLRDGLLVRLLPGRWRLRRPVGPA